MNVFQLIDAFQGSISGQHPNDWELEEYLRPVASLDPRSQQMILRQVPIIWPVSHALCINYLAKAGEILACLSSQQFSEWIKGLLDAYEAEGLRSAQHFMDDVEKHFLCKMRGESGLKLDKVHSRLLPYVQGISGGPLVLEGGDIPVTDTDKIVLPSELTFFQDESRNFLLYKFAATLQCGHLHFGTYRLQPQAHERLLQEIAARNGRLISQSQASLENFFDLFENRQLAADLFLMLQNWRIVGWIIESYPGLYGDVRPLLDELFPPIPGKRSMTIQEAMVLLDRQLHTANPGLLRTDSRNTSLPLVRVFRTLQPDGQGGEDPDHDILSRVWFCYQQLSLLGGDYLGLPQSSIFGALDCLGASEAIRRHRKEDRKKFVLNLAGLLQKTGNQESCSRPTEPTEEILPGENAAEEGALLLLAADDDRKEKEGGRAPAGLRFLTVGGREIALPDEMRQLVSRICSDFGGLPVQYISSAAGLAGQGIGSLEEVEAQSQEPLQGALLYDEWDYRRKGYKKEWCRVLEKEVPQVSGSFIGQTLEKHRGLLLKLRRQFEMMRNRQQLMKRQREGDDIDLDAVTEFFADQRAGLSPSERFFLRLLRDQRDIAVFFLVDMSSSTEGWIMNAIKESLLLMGEALHVLGDRFAIYGFSGMRRLRSEVYLVKGLEESYDETIRGRIAGIKPQEYTRMGPPIRHLVHLMDKVEARARLLIVLSDGKPEDYDDYKGRYAIEDTRHALIEAKAAGIHPFCITVDRQAKDYIEHMYGEVNYIQINDVSQLPVRIPAVYRALTSVC